MHIYMLIIKICSFCNLQTVTMATLWLQASLAWCQNKMDYIVL